jgi:hypothetical protein
MLGIRMHAYQPGQHINQVMQKALIDVNHKHVNCMSTHGSKYIHTLHSRRPVPAPPFAAQQMMTTQQTAAALQVRTAAQLHCCCCCQPLLLLLLLLLHNC